MKNIDKNLTIGKNTKNTQSKKTRGFGYQILGFGSGGGGAKFVEATGGTESTSGDFKIHTFTSPGTFCVSCAGNPGGSSTVEY